MSFSIRVSEQTLAYSYSGMLLPNNKKELTTDTQNIDKYLNNYADWKKPDKYEYIHYIIPLV